MYQQTTHGNGGAPKGQAKRRRTNGVIDTRALAEAMRAVAARTPTFPYLASQSQAWTGLPAGQEDRMWRDYALEVSRALTASVTK